MRVFGSATRVIGTPRLSKGCSMMARRARADAAAHGASLGDAERDQLFDLRHLPVTR
jgi:hypothetical protein